MEPPGKKKPEFAEDTTVKVARNRFKNVLKHMVQDNFMQDEDEDDSDNDFRMSFGYSGSQKRSKSDSTSEPPKQPASFVMKLFDRGVDLAQFQEDTPLYPVCRAWIQNKPHNSRLKMDQENGEDEVKEEDLDYREDTEEVLRLPPPIPLDLDEYGRQITMRVPPALPKGDDDEFDINYDDDMAPSPALLFQNHLDRWTTIRQRWKDSSAYNERRYDSSFAVLRAIHDRVNNSSQSQNTNNNPT